MEGDETRATEGARKRPAPHIVWQYIGSVKNGNSEVQKCKLCGLVRTGISATR